MSHTLKYRILVDKEQIKNTLQISTFQTIFGQMTVVTGYGWLTYRDIHHLYFGLPKPEHQNIISMDVSSTRLIEEINQFLENPKIYEAIKLPIAFNGTEFQEDVLEYLLSIPPGQTQTYAQVAKAIGKPKAVRAFGTACKNNPIAIIIPCHRVVLSDGSIGNYRWGTELKKKILEHEEKCLKQ